MIERGFHRIATGLIHYRRAGGTDGVPLLIVHGGPGSSLSLVTLIDGLSAQRPTIAPDLPGHGQSDAPPDGETSIGFYAECLGEFLDGLGIDRVDAYGHHSGAQIIAQLATMQPSRVRRLVLDGATLFPAEMRAEFVRDYAPPILPDAAGSHLAWTWDFASELTRHFPYYRRDEQHELKPMIQLSPEVLTDVCADVLRNWRSYHLLYGAAFRDELAGRLGGVTQPALVLETKGDPLAVYAAEVAALLPAGRLASVERASKQAAIASFLMADGGSTD